MSPALSVIVRCRDFVSAIPVGSVSRLALGEEVSGFRGRVVKARGEHFVAWDLGERLGIGPLKDAWILLRAPHRGGTVPLALRTGPCLMVHPIPEVRRLPQELFVSRRGAVTGAFTADARYGGALYGLEIDVSKLWSESELSASAALLEKYAVRSLTLT